MLGHRLGNALRRSVYLSCLCWLGFGSAFTMCLNAESRRMVIVDQDASGPAGSDMTALLVFLQSPR